MSLIIENFSSTREISSAQSAVLRALLYFDIFNHPLKAEELFHLIQDRSLDTTDVAIAIDQLCADGLIQQRNGFYFLNNKTGSVERRLKGESNADSILPAAMKFSKRIAGFPFVRAIALSGSLSKKYMDSESDIDYFITTAKGRMWVARTLLILYKKIFLLNSHKYFCVNYFVSEDALEVPDKNIFTATEISFLIPTYNYDLYSAFTKANSWSKEFLPNFPLREKEFLVRSKSFAFKSLLEKMLSGKAGEKLDEYFFRLTLKYWKRKFRHFDESTFDFRLRSRKNVSKHHPLGFQEKVLSTYSKNIAAFMHENNISLHAESPVYA